MVRSTAMKFTAILALVLLTAACSSKKAEAPPAQAATQSGAIVQASGPRAGTLEEFMVIVGDRVFYDTDIHTLDVEAQNALRRQAGWLLQNSGATIIIEGHADERGTRAYNLALGDRRATSARNYLVSLGVQANRMNTVSYGKERPESDALCSRLASPPAPPGAPGFIRSILPAQTSGPYPPPGMPRTRPGRRFCHDKSHFVWMNGH